MLGLWCVWAFGQVMLILASVPAAMNGYVLAKKMGGDAELYASTLTVQTVLSFLTVPSRFGLAKLTLPSLLA